MPTWKCNACKGVYSDATRDGSIYMHACGPLPPDENGFEAPRPNRRDERLEPDSGIRTSNIRSEGAGVTAVSHPKLTEPAWISAIKERIAKEEEE
jgi:hypothetical protein